MDELNKGLGFVRAATMAVRGCHSLDSAEKNALDYVLGQATDTLEAVKADLEEHRQRP